MPRKKRTGKLRYDAQGTLHIQVGSDEKTEARTGGDHHTVLCGASLTGTGLPISKERLRDEYRDGNLCDRCLSRLQSRGSTIPGFIRDGEVLAPQH